MEKRLILAIALSFVVLFAWSLLFKNERPPDPARDLQVTEQGIPESPAPSALEQAQKQAEKPTPEMEEPLKASEDRPEAPVEPVSGERERGLRERRSESVIIHYFPDVYVVFV